MVINTDLLDTQEPGLYSVAVQEAWNKLPDLWMSFFPQDINLFLTSGDTELDVNTLVQEQKGSGLILIMLPSEYDHDEIIRSSLIAFAYFLVHVPLIKKIIDRVARRMLLSFDFSEEEGVMVKDPEFSRGLFIHSLLAYVVDIPGERLDDDFGKDFIEHVTRVVGSLRARI